MCRTCLRSRAYIKSDFSNGLRWYTTDDFFDLTFHNLTQVEYRDFDPTGTILHDQFFVPRQRWYFEGKISPLANYYTVINRGYGSIDILDCWGDINIDPTMLQVRVGRMKTPFSYEYIKVSENDLIAPERSVFIGNFSTNRQIGAMAHGILFDSRFEYAAGVFNGQRRSFEDYNSGEDMIFFFNTRPFLKEDYVPWLQNVNLGGAYVIGSERNPLSPNALRTANDLTESSATGTMSPTFLSFNPGVFENGPRAQWSADLAYYYGSLGLMAAYQGGYQSYATNMSPALPPSVLASGPSFTANSPHYTAVDIAGWNVTAFYFLTGEQITRRKNLVEPINPLGTHNGFYGIGAVELFARVANIQLGNNIFSSGFADPKLWTNRATVTDIGFNWYLNHFIKFTVDWQHAMYGSPVWMANGQYTRHEELFWFRTQLFF